MSSASFVRPPAVAGRFYPGAPAELSREAERLIGDVSQARPVLGAIAPHAGYVYSGNIAGKVFARIAVPETVIILSPNHTGRGAPIAVVAGGAFRMPGGDIAVNEPLAHTVLERVTSATDDRRAHEQEHAVEVHLPFLRARREELTIVPIVLGGLDLDECLALGRELASATDDSTLVLASSDMNHYLDDEETRRRDRLAIEPILRLDPEGLYRACEVHKITMCGVLPATVLLSCMRERGARQAELIGYATSADAFGDTARCVGYAGVIVT